MGKYFDFAGQVAVVTGAASGIGRSAARAYAEAGCKLVLIDKQAEALEKFASELEAEGYELMARACDVTSEEAIKTVVEEAHQRFEKIDILLNCAGIAMPGAVEDLSVDRWNLSMNINVRGPYLLSKYIVPHMKEQRYGRIVNISSVNSVVADKNPPFIRHSYNASKCALNGLMLGMACSLAQYGITVNNVGPGLFKTEMTADTLFKSEAFLNAYNYANPTGRPGELEELNGLILFLSSKSCSYVTGQLILADGGGSLV
ncbi:MAG: SDR family oxidoreductase [Eubacteriales bacterium]|nr:SDR family oxidoreductase [Eubacteriales bacterium]